MPSRACIACGCPTTNRVSRHRACGGRSPSGPRLHDARQTDWAKRVLTKAKREGRWYCHKCGLPPTLADPLEAGHIVSRLFGGGYTMDNGQPEHVSCNRAEGARLARLPKGGGSFSPDR